MRNFGISRQQVETRARLLSARAHLLGKHTQVQIGPDIRMTTPLRFQGEGKVTIGRWCAIGEPNAGALGEPVVLHSRHPESQLIIEDSVFITNGATIVARSTIHIKNKAMIGARVMVLDSTFHRVDPARRWGPDTPKPVTIGERVMVFPNSMVLKGVTIGDDAIVGAATIVLKDVAPGDIVGGNPAVVIGNVYDSHGG